MSNISGLNGLVLLIGVVIAIIIMVLQKDKFSDTNTKSFMYREGKCVNTNENIDTFKNSCKSANGNIISSFCFNGFNLGKKHQCFVIPKTIPQSSTSTGNPQLR